MAHAPITRLRPYTPLTGLVGGQTFHSERQYRNALARALGFRSWAARQRLPRRVRTTSDIAALHPSERLARRQALEAVSRMRRDGLSLTRAAERSNTTPAAVVRHAGKALARSPGGRYLAVPDAILRPMSMLSTEGVIEVDIRRSGEATLIGAHWAAVGRLLERGDTSGLRPFARRKVAGHRFETDPAAIEDLGRRGVVSFEDIYRI